MFCGNTFDSLPNELYLCIFDYLNPIDLVYSFLNLNRRLNNLLKTYYISCQYIDFTKLRPNVFEFYCTHKKIHNELSSVKLNEYQFKHSPLSSSNRLRHVTLVLENDFYLESKPQLAFECLHSMTIENHSITWQKPFVICQYLKQVRIQLKNHWDLVELLNSLPIVEKVNATIDCDVTSCPGNVSSNQCSYSEKLTDFSYSVHSNRGLAYFVTDYLSIESLIKKLHNLVKLRLYVIGCMNTFIDGSRLENRTLAYLSHLEEFDFFFQTYGGSRIKSMDQFQLFKWNFGSYTNDLTDMHFLFTLPFNFHRLDECVNEYFIRGIQTTFPKPKTTAEHEKLFGMHNVKHVDLSCTITDNLLSSIRESFHSLESIRFSSSTAEYLSSKTYFPQSRHVMNSIRTLIFDQTCRYQAPFVRLAPNLNKLIISQTLLNDLLEQTTPDYFSQVSELQVYTFQQIYLQDIIRAFPNVNYLKLKTLLTSSEGPIRSFIDNRCHHRHRPVSVCDVLDDILKSQLNRLKEIEIGCYFERDEENLQAILSRLIKKHRFTNCQFHIISEDFKSNRCGHVQVLFF